MDPTARFFGKLRNLVVNLETETASLQQAHQNNDDEDRDVEVAVSALHELHSEVRALKGQVKKQLLAQQVEEDNMRSFITKCMVLKQRTTEDIQRLRKHYEIYGYKAPTNIQKNPESNSQDSDASAMEDEAELGEEDQVEVEGHQPSVPYVDPMRTPQLSDFGLSKIHLKRACGGTMFSSVETPTPTRTFHLPSLVSAMQPPIPKTPKCTLRMDEDDELQTPRIVDFGLSEHTMCLNNDFTMDLQCKQSSKLLSGSVSSGLGVMSPRPAHVLSAPLSNPMAHHLATMESPKAPVFSIPGLKITKLPQRAPSPPPRGSNDLGSPCRLGNLQGTPEVPAFETPYINRLLSTRKRGAAGGEARLEQSIGAGEPPFLEIDGPTQTFNLGTPLVRGHCSEPPTPEMPDLSSVTQDIFKLISQSKKLPTIEIQSPLKPSNIHTVTGKENRAQSLAVISEMEFLSHPSYLRQIPLTSLNQAIQKINRATEEQGHGGDLGPAGFSMEELKRITGVGTKTPMYVLCLTEMKRLERVQGVGSSDVYKVLLQTHI
ncbi:spindle and kinetochore-associated protein 3 [Esox lucius]|uniref:spindle and kinetochore-associated protein 3 n=1 Tax=Esox lucius TaxID=8010 RepID=UPI0014771A3D|nr:spindle and kinetochore-associated protein 3 [Esox lucius]